MMFENGDRIVCAGDSITWWYRDDQNLLGEGYARILDYLLSVTYPEMDLQFFNTGDNGRTSGGLYNGLNDCILNKKPDWVIMMIGANDLWRKYDSPTILNSHGDVESYKKNLFGVIEKTLPHVKGIFLLTPYYLETNREDPFRKDIDEFCDVCREAAEKYNVILVDIQKAFDDFMQYRHPTFINWDRVHPGQVGSTLIAREVLKAAGMDRALVG